MTVGAGAAGNVLASRLTEDNSTSVLLLESGGDDAKDSNINVRLESEFDHAYKTVPQERACRSMVDRVSQPSNLTFKSLDHNFVFGPRVH